MNVADAFKRIEKIDGLPTLPAVVTELDRMLRNYNISAEDLAQVIEKDQAIVPKILQLVNSAFFGLRSKISNINHALMLLGYNTVRNIVVSIAVIDALSIRKKIDGFDIAAFWSHAAAVAVVSKYLAKKIRLKEYENAFVAGLIHDIGKVTLLRFFTNEFKKAWALAKEKNMPFHDAEMAQLGISHAEIGAAVSKKWQLPEFLCHTIGYHHRVKTTVDSLELLLVVHCADIIVNNIQHEATGHKDMKALHPSAASLLKPLIVDIGQWLPEVRKEIESASTFFTQECCK